MTEIFKASPRGLPFFADRTIVDAPLYRYMDARYARRMLKFGEVRVTTLHHCRSAGIGATRSDPGEGTKHTTDIIKDLTVRTESDIPAFARGKLNFHPGQRLNGVIFSNETVSEDYYLLCLSRRFHPELKLRFGAGTCVRIDRPLAFLRALTQALGRSRVTEAVSMRPVVYGPRTGQHHSVAQIPAAWIKPEQFSSEAEVRIIWTPVSRPISPVTVRLSDPKTIVQLAVEV